MKVESLIQQNGYVTFHETKMKHIQALSWDRK